MTERHGTESAEAAKQEQAEALARMRRLIERELERRRARGWVEGEPAAATGVSRCARSACLRAGTCRARPGAPCRGEEALRLDIARRLEAALAKSVRPGRGGAGAGD
ncbi:MAG: hypothetical protein AB7O70_14685 [Hyphomicrobiales bacterium]